MASAGETPMRQLARLATAVGVLLLGLTSWAVFYYAYATPRAIALDASLLIPPDRSQRAA